MGKSDFLVAPAIFYLKLFVSLWGVDVKRTAQHCSDTEVDNLVFVVFVVTCLVVCCFHFLGRLALACAYNVFYLFLFFLLLSFFVDGVGRPLKIRSGIFFIFLGRLALACAYNVFYLFLFFLLLSLFFSLFQF